METKAKIEAALSPTAWAMALRGREIDVGGAQYACDVWQTVDAVHVAGDASSIGSMRVEKRHALAALALHGQPFGFTWADVDAIADATGRLSTHTSDPSKGTTMTRLAHLADRIAALLPPREGT